MKHNLPIATATSIDVAILRNIRHNGSMRLIFLLCFLPTAFVPNISIAQSILLDRIIALSNDYVLTGERGVKYKLADIRLPVHHPKSLSKLGRLILGKEMRFEIPKNSLDRYGRPHVHIYDANNTWINGLLIETGLAQLSGAISTFTKLEALQKLENKARLSKQGLWQTQQFQIYQTTPYNGPLFEFAIVEGTVLHAKQVKQRLYINFEEDWRKDFSIAIEKPLWQKFEAHGVNLKEIAGQRIQARGWIRKYNGPYLEIFQIGQLQLK